MLENVTVMERYPGENTSSLLKNYSPNMIKGQTPCQILERLTSPRKKERYDVYWKEGSKLTSQQFFKGFLEIFNEKNFCTSEHYKIC